MARILQKHRTVGNTSCTHTPQHTIHPHLSTTLPAPHFRLRVRELLSRVSSRSASTDLPNTLAGRECSMGGVYLGSAREGGGRERLRRGEETKSENSRAHFFVDDITALVLSSVKEAGHIKEDFVTSRAGLPTTLGARFRCNGK